MDDFFDQFGSKRAKDIIIDKLFSIPSNYVGSKRRLLMHIWDVLEKEKIQFDSAFDAFSGSAMVSLLFKVMGKKVCCNDLLTSSAITAICLLEFDKILLTDNDLFSLCKNRPRQIDSFVKNNYKDKFFTDKECSFLDCYRKNLESLDGGKLYWAIELLNKAIIMSIPNSNFSIYGKDLKSLRSTHTVGESYWTEKWRDTTRKRRNANNEIMFGKSIKEMYDKYSKSLSSLKKEYDVQMLNNQGKLYTHNILPNGQFKSVLDDKKMMVFNFDIIELLELGIIETDLLYIDPPYGGASSDYALLYSFLEEYFYKTPLNALEHIQRGSKRFNKNKGYQEQFEHLLSLCGRFRTWLISYNESSYADLPTIVSTIKNAGKTNVKTLEVPITYQYRKGKGIIDPDFGAYLESGKKHLQRGTEYLILAE